MAKIKRDGTTQTYVPNNNGSVILPQEVKKPTVPTGKFYDGKFKMP
jgi:hypothetical protein